MDQVKFGLLIKKLRTTKGITQDQLADGVCTKTHIYNIEKGLSSPALYILEGISRKLDVDIVELYRLAQYENPIEIKDFKHRLKRAYIKMDLKLFSQVLTEYSIYKDELGKYDLQHYLWAKGIVENAINNNPTKALEYYQQALTQTREGKRLDVLLDLSLTWQEVEVINSTLVAYLQISKHEKALNGYLKLIENLKSHNLDYENSTYIKILYNTSFIYEKQNQLSKAKIYIEEGNKISLELNDLTYLYKYYFLLGKLYFQEGEFSIANQYFEKYLMLASISKNSSKSINCYLNTLESKYNYVRPSVSCYTF